MPSKSIKEQDCYTYWAALKAQFVSPVEPYVAGLSLDRDPNMGFHPLTTDQESAAQVQAEQNTIRATTVSFNRHHEPERKPLSLAASRHRAPKP
jgi:hypothetical protein